MLGAIIGDIVGSTREWRNIKTEDFELVPKGSTFTDDTVMTLAVAEWLMADPEHKRESLVACMQELGRRYPNAGYGPMFNRWLHTDNPQPYGSYGNGAAMRVSPVAIYANSLDEALHLARITASVSHDHPEGIKGAQAIAACIYLNIHERWSPKDRIKAYVEEHFGYDLSTPLEQEREAYAFDASCQGSVPVAIRAFLQRPTAEKALRLAISMGGDSDTIGCMTTSIAAPIYPGNTGWISQEAVEQCRALLPADLLDINDRFEAFVSKPLTQSYSFGRPKLFAGEYPGLKYGDPAGPRIDRMLHFGVTRFIDLTEEGEQEAYAYLLPKGTSYLRFPIRDCGVPSSVEAVHHLIDRIDEWLPNEGSIYLHCRGGVGRTGTMVACYLARHMENPTLEKVLENLRMFFKDMPKAARRTTPDTQGQIAFIAKFVETCKAYKEARKARLHDGIMGCLMGGAAGDALGYPVEFMSRNEILSRYGGRGITQFSLAPNGLALVSDDTQMTLFTAAGMLMGVTRGAMRGIGGAPEKYVDGAYLDWYYTQTGRKKETFNDFHYTWLRDLPELAHRRAPGITCMNACERMLNQQQVCNDSKGCGGIMRVAPLALLRAAEVSRFDCILQLKEMAEAGAETSRVTHRHPLGFLPAALLTQVVYCLLPLPADEAARRLPGMALEALDMLPLIYPGEFEAEKEYLCNLTRQAVALAQNDCPDADNLRKLGQGWVAEETWAIALYCAIRYAHSPADALVAAVNHDGDSDSTGSVAGNLMGAMHGYEALKRQRLFCPPGRELEDTLELSELILALADDLHICCQISEYDPIETPAQKQWYERYCEMYPAGYADYPLRPSPLFRQ